MTTARKELSRIEEHGKETIVNEINHFEFDDNVLQRLQDIFDDWEYAQAHGVHIDEDDAIVLIDVDKCVDELKDRIFSAGPDEDDVQKESMIKIYLEKFKGFTIWL